MNRLLEEQFCAADFDVNMVHAGNGDATLPADLLPFGALVFTDYPAQAEADVVRLVRSFSASKPVFLFPKSSSVYAGLAQLAHDQPNIRILDTSGIEAGEWMGDGNRSTSNLHAIEALWSQIADTLRRQRTPVLTECSMSGKGKCPILVHYAYNAWWHTADGSSVYVGGPAAITVFGEDASPLTHRKHTVEKIGDWTSCATLFGVILWGGLSLRKRRNSDGLKVVLPARTQHSLPRQAGKSSSPSKKAERKVQKP